MPIEVKESDRWFEQLQLGDDLALNRIMIRWQQPLRSFAWRYLHSESDAEDMVIETFVRLYQNRRKLRANTNLSAWLFTTLSRLCLNHLRWRRRHPSVAGVARDNPLPTDPVESGLSVPQPADPARSLETSESLESLKALIDRLPHDQKTVLLLHTYEDLSLREIALIVGGSEKSVEMRLYRTRKHLRSELGRVHDLREPVRSA